MEIREYTPGNSPVVGEFSVYMPKMKLTMRRLRVVRSKAGNLFISMPQYKGVHDDWLSYCSWDESADKIFKDRVMEAVKPFIESPPAVVPPLDDSDDIPF